MQIRLDKYLADMGVGTRSEVKQHIRKKQVQVNGACADGPSQKVDPKQDQVLFQGEQILYAEKEYYMLYKPKGCVSAVTDSMHKTVLDYITNSKRKDLFPVGRLDIDTEGLLLITNDGALSHSLLSPGRHVPKTYFARVSGKVTEEDAAHFLEGVDIGEEKPTLPAQLKILSSSLVPLGKESSSLSFAHEEMREAFAHEEIREALAHQNARGNFDGSPGNAWISEIELTITEGKYHQVKRMFEAVGKKVLYLKRISMGSLKLDETLKPGEYRALTEKELSNIIQ